MMKKTIIADHRISLDERLLSTLKAIGIVTSKTGLSQLCGKNDSYFACMKKRGYGIHLGSLVFLSAKLSVQMNEEPDVRERAKLRSAVNAINEAIQQKCRLREMEIAGR
jgi:hypothetical protein